MEGKHSLKHLYNKGKSSQMKPQEFIELMNWFDQNANGMIDEAVEVTEKIDGSSNFIGYDGRIYVETFGFDKKFYDENDFDGNPYEAKARALLEYATSLPDLEDYLEDLCNDNNCASIKLQIEMLLTKFSKSEEYCQIVLVPYMYDKLGKDGNGFIIQVLNGDTFQPVKDEHIAVETLCEIMSTENFKVTGTNPKQFEAIDIKEDIQEVKDIVATYTEKMGKSVEEILTSRKKVDAEMKKALKAEIEAVQEALQDKLTEAFPVGDYGDYYEGLVFKLTNGMMFKVTSKKFKQFIAEHNHWTESLDMEYEKLEEATKEASEEYIEKAKAIVSDILVPHLKDSLNFYLMKPKGKSIYFKIKNDKIDTNGFLPIVAFYLDDSSEGKNTLVHKDTTKIKVDDRSKYHYFLATTSSGEKVEICLEGTSGCSPIMSVEAIVSEEGKTLGEWENGAGGGGAPIQEAIYGIILDCVLRGDTIDDEEITYKKITERLSDLYLRENLSPDMPFKALLGIASTHDYFIKNLSKEQYKKHFPENWIKNVSLVFEFSDSIKSIFSTNSLKENFMLLHGNIIPDNLPKEKKSFWDSLEDALMKKHYNSARDMVNPSDIYFINTSDEAFEKLQAFASKFANKTLTELEYVQDHNILQEEEAFKGISLKLPKNEIHVNFISADDEGQEHIVDEGNSFIVDLKPQKDGYINKSSINLYSRPLAYHWATSKGTIHQGACNISAPYEAKKTLLLQIKSNGGGKKSATMEAKFTDGNAQLGKGKSGIKRVLESVQTLSKKLNISIDDLSNTAAQLLAEAQAKVEKGGKGSFDEIKKYIDNSTTITTIFDNVYDPKTQFKKPYAIFTGAEKNDSSEKWYEANLDNNKNYINEDLKEAVYCVDKDIRSLASRLTQYLLNTDNIKLDEYKKVFDDKIKGKDNMLCIILKMTIIFSLCSKYPIKFVEGDTLLSIYNTARLFVNYVKIS